MTEQKRLVRLKISRVDLVDRPANPGARIAFFKRDEAEPERTAKRVLKNLKIDEISLVDSPANKGCFIKLIKRDSSPERTMPMDTETAFVCKFGIDHNIGAIDAELERMGRAEAEKRQVSLAKGYTFALGSPKGRGLYAARQTAPAGPIAKAAPSPGPAMRHEDEILDALAKQEAQRTGLPFAKAYDAVLKRPDGQAIYAKRQGYSA